MNVKDATPATVHDYPGGAESLAPRMGIKSPQVLRNKVNPTTDTHHLRLDEAVRMMAVTGDYRIIEAMAGELGGTFALLPTSQVTEQSLIAKRLDHQNHLSQCHKEIPMAQFNPDDCKFCNNTEGVCCNEAIRTDNKAQAHIIDAQDEHHHNEADAHVFMLNSLLVAKDVVMPLEQGGN